jgi:ABC-type iron transport system FetAB permease component
MGAMLAYLVLVGMSDPVWFDANHVTPPIEQIVVHLSLAAAGLIVGQLVRMVRQVTEEVFARQSPSQSPSQSLSKGGAS